MSCEDGVLYGEWSEWVPPFRHPTLTFGKVAQKTFLIINTEGWLASYEKRSVRAAVYGLIPAFGSRNRNWMEFPPDTTLEDSVASFFDGSAAEIDGDARDALLTPEPPSRLEPLYDSVGTGDPLTIGDLTLRLQDVELRHRPDAFYDATATLEARRGGRVETVHLTREPLGGDVVYEAVFDRLIGLTAVSDERASERAFLGILPLEDEGGTDSIRNAIRDVIEIGWSGGGLQLVLSPESFEVELLDGGVSRTSLTLEVIRVGVGSSTLTLHRDRPGNREFVRVYDREIALEEVDGSFDPTRVVLWVRHALAADAGSSAER